MKSLFLFARWVTKEREFVNIQPLGNTTDRGKVEAAERDLHSKYGGDLKVRLAATRIIELEV